MQSDRRLLQKASRGSRDSLRRIYEAHKDHLLTLARALTGNRTVAEDIVPDVFVAFARNVLTMRLGGSLRGYLGVSVCNRVCDPYRTEICHRPDESQVHPGPTEAATPEAQAAQAKLTNRLRTALGQAPSGSAGSPAPVNSGGAVLSGSPGTRAFRPTPPVAATTRSIAVICLTWLRFFRVSPTMASEDQNI